MMHLCIFKCIRNHKYALHIHHTCEVMCARSCIAHKVANLKQVEKKNTANEEKKNANTQFVFKSEYR